MKKILAIMNAYWQRALAYRFTVFAYRLGEIAEVLILILMWKTIYGSQQLIGGFTLEEMLTYLLIGNLFRVLVRNFLSDVIAKDIKDGRLSIFLVKPMSYFSFILYKEIGRISLTTFMSVVSQFIVILGFYQSIIWNVNVLTLFVILIMIILAFFIELFLSYLVGLIAFWTDEVDGLYASLDRIKRFFSGGYFPISLLPAAFVTASYYLPFAYSFFVPAQIYLGKIDLFTGLKGILIEIGWIIILLCIIRIVWNKGLKKYEGVGI